MYGERIETHKRSFEWYHPRPLWPSSPSSKSGVCNLANPLISGTGNATDFKFSGYIYRANPNKSPLKIWRKWSVGVSRNFPNFLGTPIISGMGKAMDFKFGRYIYGANPNCCSSITSTPAFSTPAGPCRYFHSCIFIICIFSVLSCRYFHSRFFHFRILSTSAPAA